MKLKKPAVLAGPRPPLRVGLVSDWCLPRLGGIEIHLADLAQRLRATGHFSTIVTTTPGPPHIGEIEVRRLPGLILPKFAISVSPTLGRVLRNELAEKFDVVHVHLSVVSPLGWTAILVARALKLPTVVTFHSLIGASALVYRLLDIGMRWSHWPIVFSAVSEAAAIPLRKSARTLAVQDLPNAVELNDWSNCHGLRAHGNIQIVSAMRLNTIKRPLALLRSYSRARVAVAATGLRLQLTIAGEGPERSKLERYIVRHALSEDVRILGAIPRSFLPKLYANSHIFALPSIREAFGIAALEARAAGLPIVAMKNAGPARFVRHGETGLLARDDEEFAKYLARLAIDDDLRARMSGPDASLSRYDWSEVVQDHIDLYRAAQRLTQGGDFASVPVVAM